MKLPLFLALGVLVLQGACQPTRIRPEPAPTPGRSPAPTSRLEGQDVVLVEGGETDGPGGTWFVRYLLDNQTRTCWIMIGSNLEQLDCCVLRRADAVRARISWESDWTCASRGIVSAPTRPSLPQNQAGAPYPRSPTPRWPQPTPTLAPQSGTPAGIPSAGPAPAGSAVPGAAP